jgi:hypothetical protein
MSVATETESTASTTEKKMADFGMSPEQMQQWQKLASPGPAHEILKLMAGTFDAEVNFYIPGAPGGQQSTGVMVNTLILGGRYLENRYQSAVMQGFGLMGHDNQKQKYTGIWLDIMSTKMMVCEGTADASGKVITQFADIECPMQGKERARNVTTVIDANQHTYEMFMTRPDGTEYKCLDIVYTRQK